jgi:hypothetical protein
LSAAIATRHGKCLGVTDTGIEYVIGNRATLAHCIFITFDRDRESNREYFQFDEVGAHPDTVCVSQHPTMNWIPFESICVFRRHLEVKVTDALPLNVLDNEVGFKVLEIIGVGVPTPQVCLLALATQPRRSHR